jgi:hypothetical protein
MSESVRAIEPITEAERRKRQAAADFARASVGLEGFKPSEEADTKCAAILPVKSTLPSS